MEAIVTTFLSIVLVRTVAVERCVPLRKGQARVEKRRRGQEAWLTVVYLATPAMFVKARPTNVWDRRVQSLQGAVDRTACNAGGPVCRRVGVGRTNLSVVGDAVVPEPRVLGAVQVTEIGLHISICEPLIGRRVTTYSPREVMFEYSVYGASATYLGDETLSVGK